jgi:4-amino-4-deoxy-L-arabinose transferase-like glycosyltransferase
VPTDLPPAPKPPSAWADRPVAAARAGLLALAAFVPLAAVGGLLAAGREGLVGALLGCLVPASVLLLTWGAAELGARRSAQAFAGLLLGSYLVKLVVVLALLAVLRSATQDGGSADPTAMGVAAIAGLMVALVVEALVVSRTRAPYVEP